ncbi:MAG: hypothetical protein MUO19_02875 [Dehalococcoidales bacterium]|nr:hypothetical protein [Dehalococcoidales bacterium]
MLSVIRTKACKRCRGNLSLECDVYGVYIQCIQCGATYTEKEIRELAARDAGTALRARPARTSNVS